MKKIIFLLLFIPAFANAQFKRSATELAKENIQEYLKSKLFKNPTYQPVSYGELTSRTESDRSIAWSIEHKFVITEFRIRDDKKNPVQKLYRFIFYFDNKMQIVSAESF